MRRVVITGAAGSIGSLISTRLTGRWEIRPTDLRPSGIVTALDVADERACRAVFRDADAVVHLAADPDPEATWSALRGPNVEGAQAVAAAARATGVQRLVLASSLQALSGYPPERQRRADDPPRPGNLYGATKALSEALGGWVAVTSRTSVVALRIGFFPGTERPPPTSTLVERQAWLSPGDCVRLITAAVEAEVPGGFAVVDGISANRHPFADLAAAERAIGYAPIDDAWS